MRGGRRGYYAKIFIQLFSLASVSASLSAQTDRQQRPEKLPEVVVTATKDRNAYQ